MGVACFGNAKIRAKLSELPRFRRYFDKENLFRQLQLHITLINHLMNPMKYMLMENVNVENQIRKRILNVMFVVKFSVTSAQMHQLEKIAFHA